MNPIYFSAIILALFVSSYDAVCPTTAPPPTTTTTTRPTTVTETTEVPATAPPNSDFCNYNQGRDFQSQYIPPSPGAVFTPLPAYTSQLPSYFYCCIACHENKGNGCDAFRFTFLAWNRNAGTCELYTMDESIKYQVTILQYLRTTGTRDVVGVLQNSVDPTTQAPAPEAP